MSRTDLNQKPVVSNNQLRDIIEWIKLGDGVMLHAHRKWGTLYHASCSQKKQGKEWVDQQLQNTRIIYVDVGDMPDLLLDGEWPYYIQQNGGQVCQCDLKEVVTNQQNVPFSYAYSI